MNGGHIQFTKDNFFIDGLFEDGEPIMEFVEEEETGRSTLHVYCQNECMCIKNLDHIEKKTGNKGDSTHIGFFRQDKLHGMCKRVDHIIFENVSENDWNVHLIEMKSGISDLGKWKDIKGKFRASYLIAKMIASVLEINVKQVIMYTTYERVKLDAISANPAERRAKLGVPAVSPEKEWSGENFALNINGRRAFQHIPVLMSRNAQNILEGVFSIS